MQSATVYKQNAGRTLVPLNRSDFHFVLKINEQEYFLVPTIGVFKMSHFSGNYAIFSIFFKYFARKKYLKSHSFLKNNKLNKPLL